LASHGALTNAFATQSRLVVRWTRALEAVLLTGAVTLVSATVFEPMPNHPIARVILLFTPVPLVLYAALRFGLAGAALALFIAACGAMRGAMNEATIIRATSPGIAVVVQQPWQRNPAVSSSTRTIPPRAPSRPTWR
jgi:integral membrane sensor domain MASE1